MPLSRFVRPQPDGDISPQAQTESVLVHRGLEPPVAGLVAELFLVAREQAVGPRGAPRDIDEYEPLLSGLAEHLGPPRDEEPRHCVAVLASLQFLSGPARSWTIWHADQPLLVARMVEHVATRYTDVSDALAVLLRRGREAFASLLHTGVIAALLEHGLVDPGRFVNAATIRATTKYAPGGGSWNQSNRDLDPSLPDCWVKVNAARAMASFAAMMQQEPAETLGAFAVGLERSLDLHYPSEAEHLYALLAPMAEILCTRRRLDGLEGDPIVTKCCWSYSNWAIQATPDALAKDRGPLRSLALTELGRMRGWLRATDPGSAAQFADHQDYLNRATFYVLRTDPSSLWDVLRRMLLALRDLAHLSVPLDLRGWDEGDLERLPRPWGWVPERISLLLERFLGRELERDAGLERLRGNLARFCLDRLKTSESKREGGNGVVSNEALVEPDPLWRLGYLHAVQALHVNPGGRGHNVLAWSMRHDPDEQVRAEAKLAHEALRREHRLPPGMSPRRAVHAAVWWLRQAHLVALGHEPDQEGAQRTFRKEMRRARELDEQHR